MESRLAEVVDKTVIVEVDTELSLCSCAMSLSLAD